MAPNGSLKKAIRSRLFWLSALVLIGFSFLYYLPLESRCLAFWELTRYTVPRILFLLPVAGATFVLGRVGGWGTLALAVFIMLPRALWLSSQRIDALLETATIACVGGVVVWMLEWHRRNLVVENIRLYQEIARQFEIERSVYEVVDEITSELELDRVLPKVIAIAERLAGADSGLIALWDEERNLVTYPYLHNLPRRLAHVTVPKEVGLSAEVMLTGQPTIIDDYAGYPRAIPEFVQAGVKSIVGVPIVNRDRAFGAMCVMTVERPKAFSERDVAILTGIGRQAGIAVENSYLYENLRYYARRITQAQENERKRIARELHDDTIQSLIALSRRLEGLATGEEQLPNGASARIHELWQQTGEMVRRVREFSQNLRPSVLDDLGLLPTLEELTMDMERQVGLKTEFHALGERRRLSSEVELTIFRIAQEALSNIRRHARATEVTTSVELSDTAVRLRIEDDGIGFRPPKLTDDLRAEDGLGLIGMHERVRLLGGNLQIESEPGAGTAVIAEVPI
jgi:signal transduction histidine kinase